MDDQFKAYQTMDEETRLKLIEGVKDCITPAMEEEHKRLSSLFCPRCDVRPCLPVIDANRPFVSGDILARKLMKCMNCGTVFEPTTSIVVKEGGMGDDDSMMERMLLGDYSEILGAKNE